MSQETRSMAGPSKNVLEADEFALVREYVLLTASVAVVEKNRKDIEESTNALRKLYARSALLLEERIVADLMRVRKSLTESKVKVYDGDRNSKTVNYMVMARGYAHDFSMLRSFVRVEIGVLISKYIAEMFRNNQ